MPDARPASLLPDRGALDFGTNVSGAAITGTLAFTNIGGSATGSLQAVASDATAFAVTSSSCVDPLPPGASCSVDVEFRAPGLGSSSGMLVVADAIVALSGDAIFDPGPSVSPPLHDYGALAVGASLTTTITVAATGASEGPISVSLAGDADFAIATDHCSGATLGPPCTVDVTFTPTLAGARDARLEIDIPSPGRAIHASLIGAGR